MKNKNYLAFSFFTLIVVTILPATLFAQGRGNGGGGGGGTTLPPRYSIIELGPDNYRPKSISKATADDETVWVAGDGAEFGYVAAIVSVYSQASKQVRSEYLPEPRTPLDGGPGSAIYGDHFNRASEANAVSESGYVVGGCDYYDPNANLREYSEFRATLWMNDESGYQRVDLGVASTEHNFSTASDINESGTENGVRPE